MVHASAHFKCHCNSTCYCFNKLKIELLPDAANLVVCIAVKCSVVSQEIGVNITLTKGKISEPLSCGLGWDTTESQHAYN